MPPSKSVLALDERWYPGVRDNWDDELLREWIARRLTPKSLVLDLGAGAGIVQQMDFKNSAARVCGLDLDPRVTQNRFLHEAKIGTGETIPYADGKFDVVFADNVLEHLEHPARVFAEVCRVLKPGGYFLAKTPNRWHYMPVIARLTPHTFHRFYNRLRGRAQIDTFPTRYRANSFGQLRLLAESARLEVTAMAAVESRPEYLRLNRMTYWLGHLYERLVNSWRRLQWMRILLVVEMRKPGAGAP